MMETTSDDMALAFLIIKSDFFSTSREYITTPNGINNESLVHITVG